MKLSSLVSSRRPIVWGRNAAVGTSREELYGYDQALSWPSILAAAAAVDVSSSSTDDDAEGTGALTVEVFGLDGNYAFQTETLTLNGQTAVTGTKTFLRIFGAQVLTAGSGGVNAGDIHIVKTGTGGSYTSGVPGTLTSALCKILAGAGASWNGIYTVPADGAVMLEKLVLTCRAQASTLILAYQALADEDIYTELFTFELPAGGVVTLQYPESLGLVMFEEKTDIRLRALAAGASAIASAGMFLRRVD